MIKNLFAMQSQIQYNDTLKIYQKTQGISERDQIIEWMAIKCEKFGFDLRTLELGVLYVDSYLVKTNLMKDYYELLAMTSLSLAAKFNENNFTAIIKLISPSGQQLYREEEYSQMEEYILHNMNFSLNLVTISDFLTEFNSRNDKTDRIVKFLLLDYDLMKYSYLELALAIVNMTKSNPSIGFKPSIQNITNKIWNKINQLSQEKEVSVVNDDDDQIQTQPQHGVSKKIKKRH
ncbi:hypothetical protein pb186bvf_012022 [Paramecium bursaria]